MAGAPLYLAQGAVVRGDVSMGSDVGIWHNAVLRADEDRIRIGDGSNVQDNCTLHVDRGYPVDIGKGVTIGHNAVVHGCSIGDNTVVGMGAIVLNGARIGRDCIVGAGSLVTQSADIPDGHLAFGSPARVVRELTAAEKEANRRNAEAYVELAREASGAKRR